MACPFCATGQGGLQRNMSTGEIVEQVVAGARALARDEVAGGDRRRVILTGDLVGTLVTDAEGRLHSLELPAQNRVVTRAK